MTTERPTPLTDALPMFANTNKAGANLTIMRNHARQLERMMHELAEALTLTSVVCDSRELNLLRDVKDKYNDLMKGAKHV